LTALAGLAFCDMLTDPLKKALPFLGVLAAIILAHGLYDWLMPIHVRRLSFSMLVFMLVSLFFFRRLATLRDGATDQFSMAATLVVGISILAAAVVFIAARQLGFQEAISCLISSAIGLTMAVLMFYFQLTEGMGPAEEKTPVRLA